MTSRIPFPTDYGPDTASDFIKIFRLPPEARPSRREILRRFHQPSPLPRPHVPMLDEWMEIPATTITNYLCGGCALNIPDPRGGGDWHDPWRYRRRADDPPKVARLSNDRAANPVLAHVLEHVLGTERIIDARERLALKGHPDTQKAGPPVWAASHERSTIERVLQSTIGRHNPPTPDHPEWFLDRRTVYRWLATLDQHHWVETTLESIAKELPGNRAAPIRRWIEHSFHNDAPTE